MPTFKNKGSGYQAAFTWVPLAADVLHATITGKSEHDCTIHLGQREPSPERDLGAEPTAMELAGPESTCQDIEDLYWDMYQLWRLPRRGQGEKATEDHLWGEILDSIKECL